MSILEAFQQVGSSHDHADVATRERTAATIESLVAAAAAANVPHLTLATCNRHELYWWGELPVDRAMIALAEGALRHRVGRDAVAHLLTVTAGRASMVIGEPEVLGQVRSAWHRARANGTSTGAFDRAVAAIVAAARRARREAPLAARHDSVAGAGTLLALRLLGEGAPRVTVLGAGAAGRAAGEAVRRLAPRAQLTMVARRAERAAAVASTVDGEVGEWERRGEVIDASNLVIAATGARTAVVDAHHLGTHRRTRVLLDLGLPRNIDPAVRTMPGVTLLDLDDIGRAHAEASDALHLHEFDRLLGRELHRILHEVGNPDLSDVLAALHAGADEVAARDADALIDALGLQAADAQALVRDAVRRSVRRALFQASRALRAEAQPVA